RSVDELGDLTPYDAVVLGSPVYNQRWLPAAEKLVSASLDSLAGRPVWLFSVGSFGDDRRVIGPLMKREPKGIDRIAEAVHPRGYRVFAGVIERHQWPFLSRLFYRSLGGRFGDHRNWAEVEAWADQIADEMEIKDRQQPGWRRYLDVP